MYLIEFLAFQENCFSRTCNPLFFNNKTMQQWNPWSFSLHLSNNFILHRARLRFQNLNIQSRLIEFKMKLLLTKFPKIRCKCYPPTPFLTHCFVLCNKNACIFVRRKQFVSICWLNFLCIRHGNPETKIRCCFAPRPTTEELVATPFRPGVLGLSLLQRTKLMHIPANSTRRLSSSGRWRRMCTSEQDDDDIRKTG